jgi:glycine C-acetyltransferase
MKDMSSYAEQIQALKEAGLYKRERMLEGAQGVRVRVDGREVLNFCANNYLGLANDERLKDAARKGLDQYGLGMSSVRFICGTQTIHRRLEQKIANFLGMEDAILYSSCFDANGGFFEPLLGEGDAVVSDELNHASLIDGIRLCKARRFRYRHADMADLEKQLAQARRDGAAKITIATDGVFSMDGDVAPLAPLCDLADAYRALVMVDDSHATGFFGPTGRGTAEACGVVGRVDAVTSTFGKALGGASGGFTAARRAIVDLLRQRSRPYLFSNSLPPALTLAAEACVDLLAADCDLRERLQENTRRFRAGMSRAGFDLRPGRHPIVPIMLGEARRATEMAEALLQEGVYAVGFSYPVVPRDAARIRVQISAAHTRADIDFAVAAFRKAADLIA